VFPGSPKGRGIPQKTIEHLIHCLFVEASYSKKKRFKICYQGFLVVTGVRDEGYREVLGARIADGEDELFWWGLFQDLLIDDYLE
jgi:putative transposase